VSNIIYVDLPVFTGFTYATTELAAQSRDTLLARQAHQFLRKWLIDHPKFLSNEVYIAGDSYSGIPVPAIVQEIAQGNEKGFQPRINLQEYGECGGGKRLKAIGFGVRRPIFNFSDMLEWMTGFPHVLRCDGLGSRHCSVCDH
ncbi:serine carboxypeptidase-like 18, partial [Vigna umbellata]|uniref:serine carboxypeptidase-like 18 n=1 Tax=Vigna umbellata TaxID=87088 RepID=UPI001F5F5E46